MSRLPEPGLVAATTTYTALSIRRFVLRHLCLPRMFAHIYHHPPGCESPDLIHARVQTAQSYGNFPFYVQPSIWNRWLSPMALAARLTGGPLPGDEPEKYMGGGYFFDELGPYDRMGQGKSAMEADVKRLRNVMTGGCPFG